MITTRRELPGKVTLEIMLTARLFSMFGCDELTPEDLDLQVQVNRSRVTTNSKYV